MRFIKAITNDGETEIFNLNKVLSIKPYRNNRTKILMGAGLYWSIITDTIEIIECPNELLAALSEEEI